jgi:CTP synthase
LVPFIKAAGELKSKPTQQSVAKLREIGIQPQILVCRSEHPIDLETRQKISNFCNVSVEAVIEEQDVKHTIYEVPLMLHREKLDELVLLHLGLKAPLADLKDWEKLVGRMISPKYRAKVAMVGKYLGVPDAYKSVTEALFHAASGEDTGVDLIKVDAEEIEFQRARKEFGFTSEAVNPVTAVTVGRARFGSVPVAFSKPSAKPSPSESASRSEEEKIISSA